MKEYHTSDTLYGGATGDVSKRYCPQCKQYYTHYGSWVEYTYEGKKFCSWTCKCRYKREHPPKDKVVSIQKKYIETGKKTYKCKQELLQELRSLIPEDIKYKRIYELPTGVVRKLLEIYKTSNITDALLEYDNSIDVNNLTETDIFTLLIEEIKKEKENA